MACKVEVLKKVKTHVKSSSSEKIQHRQSVATKPWITSCRCIMKAASAGKTLTVFCLTAADHFLIEYCCVLSDLKHSGNTA